MTIENLCIRASFGKEWAADHAPKDHAPELEALAGKRLRRLNRFIQIALIGALGCVQRGADGQLPAQEAALYLASSHGDVGATAAMLETLFRQQKPPMPFDFINVSSNMAGYYVARELALSGPNMMLARGSQSFLAALELAVRPGHQQSVVGAVEACAWPLSAHRRRLHVMPETPLAEASHWVWLDAAPAGPASARLLWLRRVRDWSALVAAARDSTEGPLYVVFGEGLPYGAEPMLPEGWRRFEPIGLGYHDARCARAVTAFLEQGPPGDLLLVDRQPTDANYLALLLTNRAMRA